MSFATKRAGGFSNEDLSLLDSLAPLIALRIELAHARRLTSTLLKTYLGAHAARRVEAGTIRRAEGDVIRAIIAFADLRSFTRMSNYLPPADIIAILSHYYEAVAEPLEARGGDINKLIGDGMLALFPLETDDPLYTNALASSVVQGVREAYDRLCAIPPEALPKGASKLRAGFALHVGEVTFGNVGSKSRLDFTVIGPAVNEAARLQLLTKELGRPLLISKAFSVLPCNIKFESVGTHELSGFDEKKEIFALPGF
jgi:adenylate cyclase